MAYSSKHRKRPSAKAKKRRTVFIILLAVLVTVALLIALLVIMPWKNKELDEASEAPFPPTSNETSGLPETSDVASTTTSNQETSAPETSSASSKPAEASQPKADSQTPATSASGGTQAGMDSIPYDPGDWALKLVNFETPISGDFAPELSKIKSAYNPNSLKIDSRIVEAVNIMCDAAKKDGVSLTVISAYRTNAKQNSLYNNKVDRLVAQGYEREEALAVAATAVAKPGTSEHQLGLAVDFNSVEQDFEHTKAGKWLRAHCVEYGFVIRYPSDKKELTGVIYEPWHFRFVGRKNAAKMQELGMCLEEYLEYLGK